MRKSLVSPVVMPASLMAAIHDGRLLSASICSFSMKMESVRSIRHRKGQRIRIYIFQVRDKERVTRLGRRSGGGANSRRTTLPGLLRGWSDRTRPLPITSPAMRSKKQSCRGISALASGQEDGSPNLIRKNHLDSPTNHAHLMSKSFRLGTGG